MGDPIAKVNIDAFVDIQCPYSRDIWPTLLDVMEFYKDKPVSLKVHVITLSNHRQAWDMSLGLFALADGDAKLFYSFATFIYERQEQFYNGQFSQKTHQDLIELITDLAVEHSGVDRKKFLERMNDSDIYQQARTPIRYAATKAVWETPTLFINNADEVPINSQSKTIEWQEIIDALLVD
jgi:protein-disulfide isomerase